MKNNYGTIMLKLLSYLVFILLFAGLILSSAGFIKYPNSLISSKTILIKNGYNQISINELDSLSSVSNYYFTQGLR